MLEGGIEGRPDNVLFYATSNRRHLMPREMIENERQSAIHPGEAVEEKVSLSDRFGLWLGFHPCSQDDYLAMVQGYVDHFGIADRARPAAARGAGMGPDPRRPLRPGRLAVRPGPARPRGLAPGSAARPSGASAGNQFEALIVGRLANAGHARRLCRCGRACCGPNDQRRPMARSVHPPADPGAWLLAASAAAGFCLSLFDYFWHEAPASTARPARCSWWSRARSCSGPRCVMALDRSKGPALRVFLDVSTLLGVLGTGLAAYFLEAHVLIACMALGLLGWLCAHRSSARSGAACMLRGAGPSGAL